MGVSRGSEPPCPRMLSRPLSPSPSSSCSYPLPPPHPKALKGRRPSKAVQGLREKEPLPGAANSGPLRHGSNSGNGPAAPSLACGPKFRLLRRLRLTRVGRYARRIPLPPRTVNDGPDDSARSQRKPTSNRRATATERQGIHNKHSKSATTTPTLCSCTPCALSLLCRSGHMHNSSMPLLHPPLSEAPAALLLRKVVCRNASATTSSVAGPRAKCSGPEGTARGKAEPSPTRMRDGRRHRC